MQQMSVCQMCVANWVMTPPPLGMKEDFILDTTESMEVTGGNPVFRVKPQQSNLVQPVCKHSCVTGVGGNNIHKLANSYRLIFHILCNGRVTGRSLVQ